MFFSFSVELDKFDCGHAGWSLSEFFDVGDLALGDVDLVCDGGEGVMRMEETDDLPPVVAFFGHRVAAVHLYCLM